MLLEISIKINQINSNENFFTYRPVTIAKSPRMVPGSDLAGSVAPSILRPTAMTFKPSQT